MIICFWSASLSRDGIHSTDIYTASHGSIVLNVLWVFGFDIMGIDMDMAFDTQASKFGLGRMKRTKEWIEMDWGSGAFGCDGIGLGWGQCGRVVRSVDPMMVDLIGFNE